MCTRWTTTLRNKKGQITLWTFGTPIKIHYINVMKKKKHSLAKYYDTVSPFNKMSTNTAVSWHFGLCFRFIWYGYEAGTHLLLCWQSTNLVWRKVVWQYVLVRETDVITAWNKTNLTSLFSRTSCFGSCSIPGASISSGWTPSSGPRMGRGSRLCNTKYEGNIYYHNQSFTMVYQSNK